MNPPVTEISPLTYIMLDDFEHKAQFTLPHVMTDLSGHHISLSLPQTQALMNTAREVARMEIEDRRQQDPTNERISYINPFSRKERSAFWSKIYTAVEKAAAEQTASAFNTTTEGTNAR